MTHKFDGRSVAMGRRGMMMRKRLLALRDPDAVKALFDGRASRNYPEWARKRG